MRAHRLQWVEGEGWRPAAIARQPELVLYFGARSALTDGARFRELRDLFPDAHIVGCSTGGQILDDDVVDAEVVATALSFAATPVRIASEVVSDPAESFACGETIGRQLAARDLAGVFVLSDGLAVNGSALTAGILAAVGPQAPLSGGLAGDGADFAATLVGADGPPRQNLVAAIGFYGSAIRFGHGCAGGWDVFGPRRRITRSSGNVLYELDGEPALDLYERYLGPEDSRKLPGSALLFPLRIRDGGDGGRDLVRTVLAVDRDARSMTFAGDVPSGWTAQLMRGNFDRLAEGAGEAARQAHASLGERVAGDTVALLVSCIGRRLLMGQHIASEIEAVGAEFAADVPRLGFYSYGEIAPQTGTDGSELHNQTMTVTALREEAA